jgi:DNA-binding NtrC family response regulator
MGGILIVDDRSDSRMKTIKELKNYGYQIKSLVDARYADKEIDSTMPDMVLINRQPDTFDSISLFLQLREKYPQIPVMLYVLKSDTALKSLNQAIAMAFKERRPAAAV